MGKRGQAFQGEIRDSLNKVAEPKWVYRPADAKAGYGDRSYIISPQPFDYMLLRDGVFYGFECKSSVSRTSFSFNAVTEHQVENLKMVYDCGGRGFILICNRSERGEHTCYVLNILRFLFYQADYASTGRKSVKWSELDSDGRVIKLSKDNKSQTFDLSGVVV